MTSLAIELSDRQAQALTEAAKRQPVAEADLAAATVRDLVSQLNGEFEAAAQPVLEKNRELYRRLA